MSEIELVTSWATIEISNNKLRKTQRKEKEEEEKTEVY